MGGDARWRRPARAGRFARAAALRGKNRRAARDRQPHERGAKNSVAAAEGESLDEPETFAARGKKSAGHAMRLSADSSADLGGAGIKNETLRGRVGNVDGLSR